LLLKMTRGPFVLFLFLAAAASLRASARDPARGSVRLVQLLLEHRALFAALL